MPLQQTSGNVTADAYGGKGGVAIIPNYIEDVFSTWLYTGNGATQTITNGIDLAGKGGLTWIKSRSNAVSHAFTDTARGVGRSLSSNTSGAQSLFYNDELTAFNSTGFTLGADVNQGIMNLSGQTYASWTFRKQPKFFDVVTWTGTGGNRTIPHSLGSTPGFITVKGVGQATSWWTYHRSLATNNIVFLNSTSAATDYSPDTMVGNPTSTTFEVNTSLNSIGTTWVAYIFAHNAGGFGLTGTDNVVSCGSFTTDAGGKATVNLGYEPQWVMFKHTDASAFGEWYIIDNMRGFTNPSGSSWLEAQSSAAEQTGINFAPESTGFNINFTGPANFIYIAIRRGPMKVPTNGTKVFNGIARTGTGATAVVTGVGFTPDMSMTKRRNGISTTPAMLDRLRGAPQAIYPTSTGAEVSDTTIATSFNMDGITFGNQTGVNGSGFTYINWFFQRAPGFFDEVCYTGTGASSIALTHNLQVTPELIITKCRSAAGNWWMVYSAVLGANKYLSITNNGANPAATGAVYPTTPTSNTFYVNGTFTDVGGSGLTYVSYLFATCPGVSKVGSYTGNGTTQAIACGFAGGARFVLIKRTDAAGDWYTYDTARGMTTLTDPYLLLNSTAAEAATLGSVTTTTGGFTVNAAVLAAINTNAASYIFLAIS